MSDPSPVPFNPADIETIARWVLEYPYLDWMPGSGRLPTLTITARQLFTRQTTIHTCEIQAILGRGGFGVVFLGESAATGRLAIKLCRIRRSDPQERDRERKAKELAGDLQVPLSSAAVEAFEAELASRREGVQQLLESELNRQILMRFRRETRMLQQIDDPHIVKILHVGTLRAPEPHAWDLDCIVMEFLAGEKAQRVISREAPVQIEADLRRIVLFGREVALGASAIHDHKSPHRDLSWNNVIVAAPRGDAVIVDLGNVMDRTSREGSFNLKELQAIVFGTPGFVAPEQHDSRPSPASDQFSLGVLLYRWCTGGFPFDTQTYAPNQPGGPRAIADACGTAATTWDVASQQGLRELSAVVSKALSKREEDRHPSMRDLAAQLELILCGLGAVSRERLHEAEITPVERYLECCNAMKVKAGFEQQAAGCLIVQTFVRQCRLQLENTISSLVDVVDDILTISDDLATLDSVLQQATQTVGKTIETLIAVYRHLAKALRIDAGQPPFEPQFAGRLRQRMNAVMDTAGDVGAAARRLPHRTHGSTSPPEAAAADCQTFFQLIRRVQFEIAQHDFELAVYSLQLLALTRELKANRKRKP